jgi:serpin B
MKFPAYFLLATLAGPAAFAVQPAQTSSADEAQAVKGSNAFAVDLYGHLRRQPGNLFFSPESISTAFAMAYAGARGETATQMAAVFHFTLPQDRLQPAMGALLAGMNAPHKSYELRVADALWAQQDENFLPDYLKLLRENYGAGFHRVDFPTAPEAVRGEINRWIERQTNNKIKNLIGPGTLTRATRLVLTNAIYFKGDWRDQFAKTDTKDEDFYLLASRPVKRPMMHRTGGYRYFDGGTFQELELPYAGADLAMVVLLPNDRAGLPELEQAFTAPSAMKWIDSLKPAPKVILTLPRFTMTRQFELNGALAKMGMPRAFSNAADFSGMTGKPGFTISAAIHKAFIDVNEKGTEAAAATSTVMRATAMRRPMPEPPPIIFRADHPFLFLIRDMRSGSILFLGRVIDPAS